MPNVHTELVVARIRRILRARVRAETVGSDIGDDFGGPAGPGPPVGVRDRCLAALERASRPSLSDFAINR